MTSHWASYISVKSLPDVFHISTGDNNPQRKSTITSEYSDENVDEFQDRILIFTLVQSIDDDDSGFQEEGEEGLFPCH